MRIPESELISRINAAKDVIELDDLREEVADAQDAGILAAWQAKYKSIKYDPHNIPFDI